MSLLLALVVSDGSITGTIAYTEANDAAALAGTSTPPTFSSTITYTEGNDTGAFAGSIGETGSLAYIEASDVAALAGVVGETGIIAATEGNDTAAFSGSGGDSGSSYEAHSGGWYDKARRFTSTPKPPIRPFDLWKLLPNDASIAFVEGNDAATMLAVLDLSPVIERDDEELLLALI